MGTCVLAKPAFAKVLWQGAICPIGDTRPEIEFPVGPREDVVVTASILAARDLIGEMSTAPPDLRGFHLVHEGNHVRTPSRRARRRRLTMDSGPNSHWEILPPLPTQEHGPGEARTPPSGQARRSRARSPSPSLSSRWRDSQADGQHLERPTSSGLRCPREPHSILPLPGSLPIRRPSLVAAPSMPSSESARRATPPL